MPDILDDSVLTSLFPDEVVTRHYYQLRDFAVEHPEAGAILAAID